MNPTNQPTFKKETLKALMAFLYKDQREKQKEKLKAIINKNTAMLSSSHRSFLYKNELYVYDDKERIPRIKNKLQKPLIPDMEEWLAEVDALEAEEAFYVESFLIRVLNVSSDVEDHLALLPNTLHRPYKEKWSLTYTLPDTKLSPEFVAKFTQEHQKQVEVLNKRLMLNMLLRR